MSYRRPVHCRHCYNTGHNVKSCSTLEQQVKNDVGGYYHRRYAKYFNEDGTKKTATQTKKCSYCKEEGHDKRKCETKLEDMIHNVHENARFRKMMISFINQKGVGTGALIELYGEQYLVSGINWERFTLGDDSYHNHLELLPFGTSAPYGGLRMSDYTLKYFDSEVKVLSSGVEVSNDDKIWLSGKSTLYADFHGKVANPLKDMQL